MGYIKEPKGVNFVVEPHVVIAEDWKAISEAIAYYKTHGKFKKARKGQKSRRSTTKKTKH